MNKTEIKTRTVKFKDKRMNFIVWHNLPDTFGLDFESAVINWEARTNTFDAKSLCDYINGKHTGYFCATSEQELLKLIEND